MNSNVTIARDAGESRRREFWTERLDDGYEFTREVLKAPVRECGESLVSLPDAAREAGVEVLFSEKPHARGLPRLYYLREGQIAAFLRVSEKMNSRGWMLKVEDGFRDRAMQKYVGRQAHVFDAILRKTIWELGGRVPEPEFLFRRVVTLTAQMPKIGTHMSGSAMDISVFERGSGAEVDRGAPYLEMSELTPMDSPFVSEEAGRNRLEITALLEEEGFLAYPFEFWHYNSGDAYEQVLRGDPAPARYGAIDFDIVSGAVSSIESPETPLNDLDEIAAETRASLRRIEQGGE